MYAVILAGGSGTRFWPKSREKLPKQLLRITGQGTMIQNTLARIGLIIPPQNTWVITNEHHALETCRQLKTMGFCPSRLLTEPIGRNTAAAIGYSRKSGIPFSDGLVKNRYVMRTFIAPDQHLRELGVQQKFNPHLNPPPIFSSKTFPRG